MTGQSQLSLEVFSLTSESISGADHLDAMAGQVIQILIGALGIKGATIFILNPEREELEILSSTGLSSEYMYKGPVLVDKSIKLPRNRESIVIPDVEKSDQLQYPESAKKEGIRAIVSIPVILRDRIIGALRLYHSEVWDVSSQDVRSLTVIAQSLGMAMMYFRLAAAVQAIKETVGEIHPVWL
jgi:signal transduction protein with GAF and PtsI domain